MSIQVSLSIAGVGLALFLFGLTGLSIAGYAFGLFGFGLVSVGLLATVVQAMRHHLKGTIQVWLDRFWIILSLFVFFAGPFVGIPAYVLLIRWFHEMGWTTA